MKLQFRVEFDFAHTCSEMGAYLSRCFEGAADGWMEGDILIPFDKNVQHELFLDFVSCFVESTKSKSSSYIETTHHRKSVSETLEFCKTLLADSPLLNLLVDVKNNRIIINDVAEAAATSKNNTVLIDRGFKFKIKPTTAWTAWTAAMDAGPDEEDLSCTKTSV